MTDWAGKLAGAVARIAGGLHLANIIDTPWLSEISATSMVGAISIAHYYTAHARAAFQCMASDMDIENARRIVAWAQRRDCQDGFTTRDLCRNLNFRKEELEGPLKVLLEHDYVRPHAKARNKPPKRFEINPQIKALEAPNSEVSVSVGSCR